MRMLCVIMGFVTKVGDASYEGSILSFGGLPLVCYTNDVSVNSFCLWHLGRRRT